MVDMILNIFATIGWVVLAIFFYGLTEVLKRSFVGECVQWIVMLIILAAIWIN